MHRYHVRWSRDRTWENIVDRLRQAVCVGQGHDPESSVGIIDARSVRAAPTVTAASKGYDAGKKISARKCFGIVDTLGLLVSVAFVAASTSNNTGGLAWFADALAKSDRWTTLFCDAGFKKAFNAGVKAHKVTVEVVNKIHPHRFEVLPKR